MKSIGEQFDVGLVKLQQYIDKDQNPVSPLIKSPLNFPVVIVEKPYVCKYAGIDCHHYQGRQEHN